MLSGTVKAAQKVYSMGKEGRDVSNALKTPIDEKAAAGAKNTLRDKKNSQRFNALKRYGTGAAVAGTEEQR